MPYKNLILKLGFFPKENTSGIFIKKYTDGYAIEIDFEKENFNYGNKITAESKTTQNFSQAENWVVLECVDRLLEKGYNPKDIILEKTFPSGHGHSGRLDVLVKKDKKAFLMIECKTYGKEYDKELANINKKGGQLFTYFQNDTNTEFLMLYASSLIDGNLIYKNEIIKIEDNYRTAGNVEDVFNRWNKVSNQNGIFEDWVDAYNFQNKLLTQRELKSLNKEDSEFIFYEFLSILRRHSVSDKPNAFNKIFNLFLAKIFDEKKKPNDELDFQWREKRDTPVDFQIRLINLYKEGMFTFLEKEVAGINEDDFKYFPPEKIEAQKKKWLMFNNVFAIKEVVDNESFNDNQIVLKEVVELLHKYQIRYPRRQQHLSDFFERLLTTGLKQEAGQFFTPPPITKFIIKSLPVENEIKKALDNPVAELPAVIDYAVGSGHFITEMLEEYQTIIDNLETDSFYPEVAKKVKNWVSDKYDWASKYVYGIDKDYRLVKVAKVGCYFYGDGLAQIIHGDGLDNFKNSKSYRGLLKQKEDKPNNGKFSFVISNPPYSVSSFKSNLKNANADNDFELFKYLTDRSSEIECLFVERTKQLLKEGGIASIVLPSSILSNTGIYTKAREIILKDFDIVAITELGSGTFMATGTNTVVLFLKRRKNTFAEDIQEKANNAFSNIKDVTINGIENPINKYVAHVWEGVSLDDYKTLLKQQPNKLIEQHEIYQEYKKKIKAKNEAEKRVKIIALEKEKFFYFILAYTQKVVLVKTGSKKEEKRFLGYEFSNRRGSEGIHPIQRGKSIDECTSLFANEDNVEKANYYIKKAFTDNAFDLKIPEHLQKNISYQNLVDMLTFDRIDFEKNISLSSKKKVDFEAVWKTNKLEFLSDISQIKKGKTITEAKSIKGVIPVIAGGKSPAYYHNEFNRNGNVITISASGAYSGFVNYFDNPIFASDCNTVISKDENIISTKLLFYFLKSIQQIIYGLQRGQAQPHVYGDDLSKIKIPLPPKNIQEKIVSEIEVLEKKERKTVEEIENLKNIIPKLINSLKNNKLERLENLATVSSGGTPSMKVLGYWKNGTIPWLKSEVCKEKDVLLAENFISELGYQKSSAKMLDIDSTLIALVGATKGKTAFLKFKATTNQNIAGISSIDKNIILNRYIYNVLKTMYLEIIKDLSQYDMLNLTMIRNIKIPLPTIQDQQKIVSKISTIETKITSLEKEISLIPQQKETVLKKHL